jgi:hypothetical protein
MLIVKNLVHVYGNGTRALDDVSLNVPTGMFGLLGPTLFGWFVLAPLRGNPIAAGFVLENMARGVFINGMFGVGVAAMFMLADRYLPKSP